MGKVDHVKGRWAMPTGGNSEEEPWVDTLLKVRNTVAEMPWRGLLGDHPAEERISEFGDFAIETSKTESTEKKSGGGGDQSKICKNCGILQKEEGHRRKPETVMTEICCQWTCFAGNVKRSSLERRKGCRSETHIYKGDIGRALENK